MIKKIYLFGNIGNINKLPKSGGQTSARRVMEGLRSSGFEVVPIVRHRAEFEGKIAHKLEVLTFACLDLLKIVKKLLFQKREGIVFFHLTFSGSLVPYELLISFVLKLIHVRRLMYLQGGQFMDAYQYGNFFSRWMFKKNIDMQKAVMFEGLEGMQMVQKITKTQCVYFPGYAFEKDIAKETPIRSTETINICYYGRIGPMKNVHIVIAAFDCLCNIRNNVHLTIIGGPGQSKDYVKAIDRMISHSPNQSKISRYGLSPFSFIKEKLRDQHFYLFPTHEKCEGHSNALTECMSQGVIPIVSDYHFNRSVVGNDSLVVEGYEPQKYAEKINAIIESGRIQELSEELRLRVKTLFSFEVVNRRICEVIRSI